MKSHFVPSYYQHDLRMKLQTLKQGEKGVEAYYQELIIGLACCDIHEDDEDTCAKFFGGLNRDIQDILDYKDWNRFNQLYHLALKAEKEVLHHLFGPSWPCIVSGLKPMLWVPPPWSPPTLARPFWVQNQ